MKIAELIESLEEFMEENGDMEVEVLNMAGRAGEPTVESRYHTQGCNKWETCIIQSSNRRNG